MECPVCAEPCQGWNRLHHHLAEAHADLVTLVEEGPGETAAEVRCPGCGWTHRVSLGGRRRRVDAFLDAYREEVVLVAFDQFIVHWVDEHVSDDAEQAGTAGGRRGDSERV